MPDARVSCDGCGRYHGSEGEAHRCMTETIRELRKRVVAAEMLSKHCIELLMAVRKLVAE